MWVIETFCHTNGTCALDDIIRTIWKMTVISEHNTVGCMGFPSYYCLCVGLIAHSGPSTKCTQWLCANRWFCEDGSECRGAIISGQKLDHIFALHSDRNETSRKIKQPKQNWTRDRIVLFRPRNVYMQLLKMVIRLIESPTTKTKPTEQRQVRLLLFYGENIKNHTRTCSHVLICVRARAFEYNRIYNLVLCECVCVFSVALITVWVVKEYHRAHICMRDVREKKFVCVCFA